MKSFLAPTYTFTPGASGVGTVNLSGIAGFNIKFLVAVINQTRGVTIYATGDAATRYTALSGITLSGATLTLFADTTGHSSSDVLQVIYEDQTGAPIADTAIQNLAATPVRQVGQMVDGAGFSAVGASVLDPYFNAPITSGSVTYNQSAGSLNIVAGTTINSEFLARSVKSYRGSMRMRFGIISSQRIANNNLAVMLADLIGEGLAYTINSATSVTVAVSNHTLTSTDVGQFIQMGGITGAAAVPGRYAIASVVAGTSITFTVSGFPASGTGTCTLFGRNYLRNLLTASTTNVINVDAQRNGWATGDSSASFNNTTSPGLLVQMETTGREVFWSDTVRTSVVNATVVSRANRYENIPDATTELYVFVWNFNGTTAPTSSTTWTLGSVSIESFANNSVYLQGVRSVGTTNALPISVTSGTLQTVNTCSSVTSSASAVPLLVNDVVSAAITTTATVNASNPGAGCSYIINIPVTVVSGTSPTLDIDVQESDDTATNWQIVYSFPRITATGIYRSPKIAFNGNRIRYVQTVGGTTPSFTRAVNRLTCSDSPDAIRQLIDRSIVLTTLSSATASINTQNCQRAQLVVSIGAATVAPILQLQGSDDNALSWYAIGTPLTAIASSTVQVTVASVNSQLMRAIVSTAGTTVTANYVLIKGF